MATTETEKSLVDFEKSLAELKNAGPNFDPDNNPFLRDIKNSISQMQEKMQQTYTGLQDQKIIGKSHDESIKITMSATYHFEDIDFDEKALRGGVKEFKWRIREAWQNAIKQIQEQTQKETMKLLQSMQLPDDIRNMTGSEE